MKIGILQTGHAAAEVAERHGDYADMFGRLLGGHDFEFVTYDVVDMEFPKDVHDAGGWLITGSRHGVYDDLPFIAPLEAFIRAAYAAHVPLVGICFGHQIVAQALGGKVEKFAHGWAVGRTAYAFEGMGDLALNAWHQDQVTRPPEGARVIATSDFCRYAGLAYDDRALTVQAHPEFTNGLIGEYVQMRRGTMGISDAAMDSAEAGLDQPVAAGALAERIAAFFMQSRKSQNG